MTGNRFGMSDSAKKKLIEFIENNNITEVHHGDCVGADKDFHDICESFNIKIIIQGVWILVWAWEWAWERGWTQA